MQSSSEKPSGLLNTTKGQQGRSLLRDDPGVVRRNDRQTMERLNGLVDKAGMKQNNRQIEAFSLIERRQPDNATLVPQRLLIIAQTLPDPRQTLTGQNRRRRHALQAAQTALGLGRASVGFQQNSKIAKRFQRFRVVVHGTATCLQSLAAAPQPMQGDAQKRQETHMVRRVPKSGAADPLSIRKLTRAQMMKNKIEAGLHGDGAQSEGGRGASV